MWTNDYISKQLIFRLAPLAVIKNEQRPFTDGNFTAFYKYKDEHLLWYNYRPDGTLIGKSFVINPSVKDDPKGAVEFGGRKGEGTFSKRLVLAKCGENDLEKFNYISELLYQVIKQI